MKEMKKILFHRATCLMITLLFGLALSAQQKELKKALADFDDMQYVQALEHYMTALEKAGDDKLVYDHTVFMIGECYRMMNDYTRADDWYSRLAESNYGEGRPVYYLRYADILRTRGKIGEAREFYRKYLKADPHNELAKTGLKSCDWVQASEGKRIQVNIHRVPPVNSELDDFAPVFTSADRKQMIITSNRAGVTGKYVDKWHGAGFSDLFLTTRNGDGWSTPELFDKTGRINSEVNEGTPAFNTDFSVMYFTRCARSDEKMRYCEILKTQRTDNGWSEPEAVLSDTAANMGHPTLSSDELTLWFSSDRKGGEGGNDLWTARRTATDQPFGKPEKPGGGINTAGDELFPYLSNDTTLYFSSSGWPGYGGLDIFRSVIKGNAWSAPENLLWPVNSGYDDFGIIFSIAGEEGYFSSNRMGGQGGDDIYGFTRRVIQFQASGRVKDQMTLLPVEGALVLMISHAGDSVFTRTGTDGRYHFDTTMIREAHDYELQVRMENYFAGKDGFSTRPYKNDHHFRTDFVLEPIPDMPIVLPDILYALDDWRLQPQYEDSLRQLVDLLRLNETLVIELRSHTDSRASFEYNDVLSQKRAQSVVDFLISQGIDPGRLVAKGYGERVFRVLTRDVTRENYLFKAGTLLDDPFVMSLPSKEIQEAAFQLNRRTEFYVLARDYKPAKGRVAREMPVIRVISDTTAATLDFSYTDDGRITVMVYLNDYGSEGLMDVSAGQSMIGAGLVMSLLKKGAVNRNDFSGVFEEVMAEGKVAGGSELTIRKVRIGDKEVGAVKFRVDEAIGEQMVIGPGLLEKLGEFTVDENNKQLIFR